MTFHIVYDNSFDSSLAAAIISAYIKSSDEKNEKTINAYDFRRLRYQ